MLSEADKSRMERKESDLEEPSSVAGVADLTIDRHAEARLVRKLDMWLAPMMILFFLVAYLDRSNIGNGP